MSDKQDHPTQPQKSDVDEARRALLRSVAYVSPVVLGRLLMNDNVLAQPVSCNPDTCNPSNCAPAGCPPVRN